MSRPWRRLILAALGWFAAATGLPALADAPLRVCLQADDPPLSSRRSGEAGGFDVAVTKLIAERLGRPLEIQWFTTRDDPDSNPVTEADALLSDGHCMLVAGYPLVADQLGRPRAGTGNFRRSRGRTRTTGGAGSAWVNSFQRTHTGSTRSLSRCRPLERIDRYTVCRT